MLTMLFETGHPWITFKDPSNIRSPQDHLGVVHSSNLCTEILLNTSKDETAVCNLGSINLAAHTATSGLDTELLKRTIRTAMRMLDNVIDINFYPTPEARNANLKHRPVGLGIMGFQDALYNLRIPYASEPAVEFADTSMELISYHAILASTEMNRPDLIGTSLDRRWLNAECATATLWPSLPPQPFRTLQASVSRSSRPTKTFLRSQISRAISQR
jgi:ribonucleoside-diphosphate reductase alpha chain